MTHPLTYVYYKHEEKSSKKSHNSLYKSANMAVNTRKNQINTDNVTAFYVNASDIIFTEISEDLCHIVRK